MGNVATETCETKDDSEDEFADVDLCDYLGEASISSTPEIADRSVTRSSSAQSLKSPVYSLRSVATQTEAISLEEANFPKISTRIPSKVKGKEGVLIHPKILECIVECETTA